MEKKEEKELESLRKENLNKQTPISSQKFMINGVNKNFEIKEIDYLIVATGYTSRLISKLNYKLKKDNKLKHKHDLIPLSIRSLTQDEKDEESDLEIDELLSDDITENIRFINKRLLFINDAIWGNGLYIVNGCEDISNKIMEIITQNIPYLSGFVCLGNANYDGHDSIGIGKAIKCIEILGKLNYCAYLEVYGIYKIQYIKENGLKLCIICVDTESG